jgi:hypothetical protein
MQWAVSATAFATLLGSSLTIIVSELFSLVDVPFVMNAQVRYSSITHEGNPSTDLDQGILSAGLIVHRNMSEPRFTYQDMVFPGISMINSSALASGAVTVHQNH